MHLITRSRSILDARAAVLYLWRHGVVAMLHNPIRDSLIYVPNFGDGDIEILIADKRERDLALGLLEELKSPEEHDAGAPEPEDLDAESLPDLSLLDTSLAPACPDCTTVLQLVATLEQCPACRSEVDVVELLIARHGPEILEACYPDEPLDLEEHVLIAAAVPCDRCDNTLGSLPVQGHCPECGEPYDKEAYVRRCLG